MQLILFAMITLAVYLVGGLLFGIPFVCRGVNRIDPHARPGTWGFRLLILPGTILLWPLLLWRWWSGCPHPPEENNAHRAAARLPS